MTSPKSSQPGALARTLDKVSGFFGRECIVFNFVVKFKHKTINSFFQYLPRVYTLQHTHQIKYVLAYSCVGFVPFSLYEVDLNN